MKFGSLGEYVINASNNIPPAKKIKTPNELSLSITFNRNKNIGIKLKKMGVKILKKTIKDLDNVINNEFKKT